MKKLILVLAIIFGLAQVGYSDSVNTYDINTDPLTTDYLFGIDDPSGLRILGYETGRTLHEGYGEK